MNFKQIKQFSEELREQLTDFMYKSKPFSFCEHPSYRIRMFNIRQYIDFLQSNGLNYIITEDEKIISFLSVKTEKTQMEILFLVYLGQQNNKAAVKNLEFAVKELKNLYPDVEQIYSLISRNFKLKKMLSWLLKYSKDCEIVLDKSPNLVYFYKRHGLQK